MTTDRITTDSPAVLTAAEIKSHWSSRWGRDYSESQDGYEDMEVESARGWSAVPSWGEDGWDLGEWPYVVYYVNATNGLLQICEGDREFWQFDSAEQRSAAIDHLFLRTCDHPEITVVREAWEYGEQVPERFRGAFSSARLREATK